jgi:hypothetical protein
MSANSLLNRTGQTLGPLYAGTFFAIAGLTGVFLSGAALILIMAGITLPLLIHENRHPSDQGNENNRL